MNPKRASKAVFPSTFSAHEFGACVLQLHFWEHRSKMATPAKSLDDLLNSEVDESAVSALVGSLESQLLSQSTAASTGQVSGSSTDANHVNSVSVSDGTSQGQKLGLANMNPNVHGLVKSELQVENQNSMLSIKPPVHALNASSVVSSTLVSSVASSVSSGNVSMVSSNSLNSTGSNVNVIGNNIPNATISSSSAQLSQGQASSNAGAPLLVNTATSASTASTVNSANVSNVGGSISATNVGVVQNPVVSINGGSSNFPPNTVATTARRTPPNSSVQNQPPPFSVNVVQQPNGMPSTPHTTGASQNKPLTITVTVPKPTTPTPNINSKMTVREQLAAQHKLHGATGAAVQPGAANAGASDQANPSGVNGPHVVKQESGSQQQPSLAPNMVTIGQGGGIQHGTLQQTGTQPGPIQPGTIQQQTIQPQVTIQQRTLQQPLINVVTATTIRNANPGSVTVVPSAPGTPQAQTRLVATVQQPSTQQQQPTRPTITSTPMRITPQQPAIAPRPPGPMTATVTLPPGFTIPQGMVLVKQENGNLALMPASALPASLQPRHNASNVPGTATFKLTTTQGVQPGVSTQVITRPAGPTQPAQIKPAPQPTQMVQTAIQPQPVAMAQPRMVQTTPGTGHIATTILPGATTVPVQPPAQSTLTLTPEAIENVKKCKNFLTTLVKLASSGNQPPEVVKNVKELVQNLLDAKIEPEEFTLKLQTELKSSPQPYLVPFLKKSLPYVRQALAKGGAIGGMQIPPQTSSIAQAPVATTTTLVTSTSTSRQTVVVTTQSQHPPNVRHQAAIKIAQMTAFQQAQLKAMGHATTQATNHQQRPVLVTTQPTGVPGVHIIRGSPAQQKGGVMRFVPGTPQASHKVKDSPSRPQGRHPGGHAGFSRDDDDINDVASMAGVNLSEESARILATNSELVATELRSCKDETFLSSAPLRKRILEIARKHGLEDASPDVVSLVSHAAEERLRNLLEKLTVIVRHRMESYKDDSRYEVTGQVRQQVKFLEELDRLEKKRHDEQEREMLLRAAKSRSRQEDPEQLKLKQKAKELQQLELEKIRNQEANMTALMAIGPRKKRKVDSPGPGSSSSFTPGASVQPVRPRTKRANLRDLIFLLEQEKETCKSNMLYKAYLK
ncbi:PREDICTED: transcription initiation factor TFIID subunit 4-like isoform X2 [Branchiostoma belcheri]|uniref:Transcription initiation factor TFIID subunit 4-like isoform X2 n=1 Tax=Branchiostoma belcheri TaxID=7741 RepID=A0A6P4YZ28_BRABE|nr:PREDICTED: transcription initiation factor TFIID subunit 4-like isoform X2 [Branchiostoma belcheri]